MHYDPLLGHVGIEGDLEEWLGKGSDFLWEDAECNAPRIVSCLVTDAGGLLTDGVRKCWQFRFRPRKLLGSEVGLRSQSPIACSSIV